MKIIKYWRDGCQPCKMLSVILDKVKIGLPHLVIEEVNTNTVDKLALMESGIRSVPTMFIYNDRNELVEKVVGFINEEKLLSLLKKLEN